MIRKMTFGLIVAATIGAFAFTVPKTKTVNYTIDTKTTTATWLAKKVTGQHEGGVSISKGNIISDGKTITGGSFEIDMTAPLVENGQTPNERRGRALVIWLLSRYCPEPRTVSKEIDFDYDELVAGSIIYPKNRSYRSEIRLEVRQNKGLCGKEGVT